MFGRVIEKPQPEAFDVICAGQPLWRGSVPSRGNVAPASASAFVSVTKMMARASLRVGWAATIEDDRRGRALLAEMAAANVHVGAVSLVPPGAGLVLVDASWGWSGLVSDREATAPMEIPAYWSSRVLLLSGLRPGTAGLAAFCKAARRARRDGTVVVLDLVGSLRDWNGHDPRVIAMVIREADVVRCNFFDLAVIGTDATAVRRAMKPGATLVFGHDGGVTAVGTFGDVSAEPPRDLRARGVLAESTTAAICAEFARPGGAGETPAARWQRVLRHEAPKLAPSAG
jgi:hypothetical protein